VPEAVVGCALVWILEDLVGLVDLLETGLAIAVAGIAIRMPLHRELAKRRLQHALVGVTVDLEHVVVAAFSHPGGPPRHFLRGIIVRACLFAHEGTENMHPRVWPRGCCDRSKAHMASAALGLGRLLVLLVVVDLGEFRVDDVLLLGGAIAAASIA